MHVFLVNHTTPDRTNCVAACASSAGAERQAVKFMAGHMDREPWIQTGLATWELRARRERLEIASKVVVD